MSAALIKIKIVNMPPKRKQTAHKRKVISRRRRVPADLVAGSEGGLNYLKCAIAPKDFPGIMSGIPDAYCGKSAVIRQKILLPIGPPANTTTSWNASIVIPPIPNVAAMVVSNKDTTAQPNTVAAVWTVHDYVNASTIFPSPNLPPEYGTSMVQQFRYVSLTAELKMVGPVLSTGGTVCGARIPGFGLQQAHTTTGTAANFMTGFDDVDQVGMQSLPGYHIDHVNAGLYGWSIHQDPAVAFQSLWINSKYDTVEYSESGTPVAGAGASGYFLGFGRQQALGIAVTGATPSTNFVLEVEAVIEYQPRADSIMTEMMSDAPPHDRLALDAYEKAVRSMPAFVPVSKNSGFWDAFLHIVAFGAPIVGSIFGPLGRATGAVIGTAAEALRIGIGGS